MKFYKYFGNALKDTFAKDELKDDKGNPIIASLKTVTFDEKEFQQERIKKINKFLKRLKYKK